MTPQISDFNQNFPRKPTCNDKTLKLYTKTWNQDKKRQTIINIHSNPHWV